MEVVFVLAVVAVLMVLLDGRRTSPAQEARQLASETSLKRLRELFPHADVFLDEGRAQARDLVLGDVTGVSASLRDTELQLQLLLSLSSFPIYVVWNHESGLTVEYEGSLFALPDTVEGRIPKCVNEVALMGGSAFINMDAQDLSRDDVLACVMRVQESALEMWPRDEPTMWLRVFTEAGVRHQMATAHVAYGHLLLKFPEGPEFTAVEQMLQSVAYVPLLSLLLRERKLRMSLASWSDTLCWRLLQHALLADEEEAPVWDDLLLLQNHLARCVDVEALGWAAQNAREAFVLVVESTLASEHMTHEDVVQSLEHGLDDFQGEPLRELLFVMSRFPSPLWLGSLMTLSAQAVHEHTDQVLPLLQPLLEGNAVPIQLQDTLFQVLVMPDASPMWVDVLAASRDARLYPRVVLALHEHPRASMLTALKHRLVARAEHAPSRGGLAMVDAAEASGGLTQVGEQGRLEVVEHD